MKYEDAKAYLGEIGWALVQLRGGWENLCQIQNDEIGITTAQLRESAKALLNRKKRGEELLPRLNRELGDERDKLSVLKLPGDGDLL